MAADRWFKALFVIGCVLLLVLVGAAGMHFRLSAFKPLTAAFETAAAWYETRQRESEGTEAQTLAAGGKLFPARVSGEAALASPGYTLVSLQYSTTAYLVDTEGRIVHRWDMPFRKAWPNPTHVHEFAKAMVTISKVQAFPNGDLIAQYHGDGDTPYGYGIAKFDKDSNVLWAYGESAHHDFSVDEENGNIYAIVQKLAVDPLPGLEDLAYPCFVDYVVTLSPDGKEIDRIPLMEAFRDSPYALMLYHPPDQKDKVWDPLHTNSVRKLEPKIAAAFPMFKPGQFLLSLRNLDALAVLDPASRKIVWAMQGIWKAQHHALFLPNGRLLLLDNRGHYAAGREFSRALEIDPVSGTVAWSFAGSPAQSFYTVVVGRLQRLSNGNTLLVESMNSRLLEVTPDGRIAWSYTLQVPNKKVWLIADAERYPAAALPFLKK